MEAAGGGISDLKGIHLPRPDVMNGLHLSQRMDENGWGGAEVTHVDLGD